MDQLIPAGTGSDGFTGIDNLFAFAAAAGVKVIYTLRLLSPAANPVADLQAVHAQAAGHIWGHHQENVASFAIGNEPDWHAYHTYPGHPLDPAIYEDAPGVPGSAYASYLAQWRSFADAIMGAAPGASLSGPDLGAYTTRPTVPARAAVWRGPNSLPATSRPPGGLPRSPSITTWGMNPGRPPPSRRSATCCPPNG